MSGSEQKAGPVLTEYGTSRALRQKMGSISAYDPKYAAEYQMEDKKSIEAKRIKRYGEDGKAFNDAIVQWQQESSQIRGFFLGGEIPEFWNLNNPRQVFSALRAFWLVMTRQKGYTIDTLAQDTILYRGVRLELAELPKPGYIMINTLTNWSSASKVSSGFTGAECCMLQCKFPKGTQFYFTGLGKLEEFEHIVPGGGFLAVADPVPVRSPWRAKVMMWQLEFQPVVQHPFYTNGQVWNQFFPWPSESPLKATVANYWDEYSKKIAARPGLIKRSERQLGEYLQQMPQPPPPPPPPPTIGPAAAQPQPVAMQLTLAQTPSPPSSNIAAMQITSPLTNYGQSPASPAVTLQLSPTPPFATMDLTGGFAGHKHPWHKYCSSGAGFQRLPPSVFGATGTTAGFNRRFGGRQYPPFLRRFRRTK